MSVVDVEQKTSASPCKGLLLDLEALKPYYAAIAQIRRTLDAIPRRIFNSPFKGWPEPNPYWWRTPKYLILETEMFDSGTEPIEEHITKLYSPLGEIRLCPGGGLDDLIKISKTFMANVKWKIEDATTRVQWADYIQEKDRVIRPRQLSKEDRESKRFYLVKSVGDIALAPETIPDNEPLLVYVSLGLTQDQYALDKKMFATLSSDKRCF